MSDWVKNKSKKAIKRKYFRTVDLFAGCGGLSLGFDRAGFKSVAAIEINDKARESHQLNFSDKVPCGYKSFTDIRDTPPEKAVEHLCSNTESVEDVIDIVVGGPPCQAFSRLGRAALWRLAGEDYAHAADERANYYLDYLHYISNLRPLAFVMENVREIGKFIKKNIAEEIAVTAEEMGYETRYALLNATWYGVPQLRERMFIIGIRKELGTIPSFPAVERKYDLPVGYSTARAGNGHAQVLPPWDHYEDHFIAKSRLRPAVSASEAFWDLPPITMHLDGRNGKGNKRDTNQFFEYLDQESEFSRMMKSWPGFRSNGRFCGNVIRYTPRDYETFKRMPHGGMYPEALETANKIFKERVTAAEVDLGKRIPEGSEEWNEIFKATVPPYKNNRYPNKFRKMWPDHPARTVPAHIGKDSYSHIHFDSEQARCISLREAARLQSFPDAFRFAGSMNSQLTQIGNAVPPLLAWAVAKNLDTQLQKALIAQAGD
ncbi:MAG: DNA cytosine methyltransferase [Desulforhopalus sp.]